MHVKKKYWVSNSFLGRAIKRGCTRSRVLLYQIDVDISCFVIKVQKMTFTKLLVLVHSSVWNMLLFSFLNIIPLALVFKTCTLQETTSSKGGILIFFCISVELYNSYKYDRVCINNWYTYKQKSRDYIIVSFKFSGEKIKATFCLRKTLWHILETKMTIISMSVNQP